MKIVLAPDSFKHSLSAQEVCNAMEAGIREIIPDAEIIKLPVADGGEGTVDAVLSTLGGRIIPVVVTGPEFTPVDAFYGMTDDKTAIIEMAAACGLPLMKTPNPEKAGTLGFGQLIVRALDDGCSKIILCIGGSATNDAGIGMMSALGARFLDSEGKEIIPIGMNLGMIQSIDLTNFDRRLNEVEIFVACDVNNPLYGPTGAAFVFAPQKGADSDMVIRLDNGLRHFSDIIAEITGVELGRVAGLGAAGGVTAGLYVFCNAKLMRGIDIVLNTVDFDNVVKDVSLVITGEGKTDSQTLHGKVPAGIAERCSDHGIPVIIISGATETYVQQSLYHKGVGAIFPAILQAGSFESIKPFSTEWLSVTTRNIIKTLLIGLEIKKDRICE